MKVYDYSFVEPKPKPSTLVSNGAVGVMRYLCPHRTDPRKDAKRLTRPELDALHAAGLRVALVWQDGSNSSSWDGVEANRQADALGFPTFVPIYYAEESLTPLDVLARRLDGLPDTRPKRLYDGAPRIQAMIDEGHVTGGWITGALSASQLPGEHPHPTLEEAIARAPGAQLVQLVGSDVPGTDLNRILKPDWGGWHPDQPFEEEDMPLNDADKKFIRDQVLDIVRQEGISANAASSATGVLTVLNAIGNLDLHLDVDEGALAKALAPALTARLGALSEKDLNDVATAVNDEQSRRGGR